MATCWLGLWKLIPYFRDPSQLNRVLTGHKLPTSSIFKFAEEQGKSVSTE